MTYYDPEMPDNILKVVEKHLGAIEKGLDYVSFWYEEGKVCLDGIYTIEQLKAILATMEAIEREIKHCA